MMKTHFQSSFVPKKRKRHTFKLLLRLIYIRHIKRSGWIHATRQHFFFVKKNMPRDQNQNSGILQGLKSKFGNFTGTKIKIKIAIFFPFLLLPSHKYKKVTFFHHFFNFSFLPPFFLPFSIPVFLVSIDNHNYINTKISE
jgi:hypothetical protein